MMESLDYGLEQWFSEYGPWPANIHITWELVNLLKRSTPSPTATLLNQKLVKESKCV